MTSGQWAAIKSVDQGGLPSLAKGLTALLSLPARALKRFTRQLLEQRVIAAGKPPQVPERALHRHFSHGGLQRRAVEQCPVGAVEATQAQPVGRGHAGVGLERMLQLAQRHSGNLGKLQQVEGLLGGIGRPFADALHHRALFSTTLQAATIQADARVIEDVQAVFEQLLRQRFLARWIQGLCQSGQGAAQPAAEQRVLARIQRRHEQAFQPGDIQAVALDKRRPEDHGDFLVILRGDPDVAAFFIEHVQRVVAAIETERQRPLGRAEILLDPGVHVLFLDLHALQIEVTHPPGEMPRRHLLIMLDPARCGADLLGHVGGIEGLDLYGIARCHG